MAFERNFFVSLRYLFLVVFLILIINALSSDYGVNGEDPAADGKPKIGNEGVTGAKGSDSAKGTSETKNQQKRPRKKKLHVNATLGNLGVPQAGDDTKPVPTQPKAVLPKPPSPDGSNRRTGLMGNTKAEPAAVDNSAVNKEEDEDGDDDAEKGDTGNKDGEPPKRPSKTGAESDTAQLSKVDYEEDDDEQDEAEIQLNPSGNTFAKTEKEALRKKSPTDDVSSAGSFMTYFVIVAIIVIIGYLILHNKKKLMAYIVEGRNTGRGRRQRPTSSNGSEYKPLKNAEEVPLGRLEEA